MRSSGTKTICPEMSKANKAKQTYMICVLIRFQQTVKDYHELPKFYIKYFLSSDLSQICRWVSNSTHCDGIIHFFIDKAAKDWFISTTIKWHVIKDIKKLNKLTNEYLGLIVTRWHDSHKLSSLLLQITNGSSLALTITISQSSLPFKRQCYALKNDNKRSINVLLWWYF